MAAVLRDMRKYVLERLRDDTLSVCATLHRECLARPCLPIGKDGAIVALQDALHDVPGCPIIDLGQHDDDVKDLCPGSGNHKLHSLAFPHLALSALESEDSVEGESSLRKLAFQPWIRKDYLALFPAHLDNGLQAGFGGAERATPYCYPHAFWTAFLVKISHIIDASVAYLKSSQRARKHPLLDRLRM